MTEGGAPSALPVRVLSPRSLPLPPPPRWAVATLAIAFPTAVVTSLAGIPGLDPLAHLCLILVGFRLGAWLDGWAYRLLEPHPAWLRLLGTLVVPALGPACLVALGAVGEVLGDDNPLSSAVAVFVVPAALWFTGASLGAIPVTVIDVVVTGLVRGFRTRITLAILFLVALVSAAITAAAVAWYAVQKQILEEGTPELHLRGEDGLDNAWAQLKPYLESHPEVTLVLALLLAAVLGLPAVISAAAKLADAVLTRFRPLVAAFDEVAAGARDVRLEEAGSRELVEIAQHFNHMLEGLALSERMERAFGRYVGQDLLDQIRAQHGEAELPAQTKDATVFFADLRGFTTMSEKLTPEAVVSVLNRYFERVVAVIEEHDGYLNKFIGDAVVVVFNGPVDQDDHAPRAVRCAVAMIRAAGQMSAEGAFPEVGTLQVGAGINSGPMVCGNIGSQAQMEYTVIGDAVNLASRVEGLTKQYGATLLITEGTRARLGEGDAGFTLRRVDRVAAKGKAEPVVLYEVLDAHDDGQRDLRTATLPRFTDGLAAFYDGDPAAALACFEEVLEDNPGDAAARLYVERCQRFLAEGVPAQWDGVVRMTTK